jgi:hypothetical protein
MLDLISRNARWYVATHLPPAKATCPTPQSGSSVNAKAIFRTFAGTVGQFINE